MNIRETDNGVIIKVYVKPKSKEFKIVRHVDKFTLFCREVPVKGKVNKELVKKLSKIFETEILILSGFTSIEKKILIKNLKLVSVEKILSRI